MQRVYRPAGARPLLLITHGLRRGLYSCAAVAAVVAGSAQTGSITIYLSHNLETPVFCRNLRYGLTVTIATPCDETVAEYLPVNRPTSFFCHRSRTAASK